jgi:hypothetical protein
MCIEKHMSCICKCSMWWGGMYTNAHTFCIDSVVLETSFGNGSVE